MAGTDNVSMQIYQKMPDIHIMLVNNILSLSLEDENKDNTTYNKTLIQNKLLIKEALWALSNIAACPPIVNQTLLDEDIIDSVMQVASRVDGLYHEVFQECAYIITNLITNATPSNMVKLMRQNVILMMIRALEYNKV